MDSCSASLSIQRLFSFPRASRVITTVILGVALSGALSACIRVHVDLATTGTAVPLDNPSKTITGDGEPGVTTTKQCDLKFQINSARQETGSWCWVASAQLVVEYLTQKRVDQCALVTTAFEPRLTEKQAESLKKYDCCDYLNGDLDAAGAIGGICDKGGWPEMILDVKGITYKKNDVRRGLDWDGLTEQICNDRPFIFVVQWSGGGRHSSVGGGYHTTAKFGNFVDVYDHSIEGFFVMPEEEFRGNSGDFTHEFDYVDIQLNN